MENRIAELRKEKNMTLKELGEKLKIRDNTLSQYETGKRNPQLGTLQEIANFFDVSLDYLIKETDKRDYEVNSDEEAISLIKKIGSNEINIMQISSNTLSSLTIWILANKFNFERGAYRQFINTANNIVNESISENEILQTYRKIRNKENELVNLIDDKLLEDDEYYGATPNQVLDFMKESERLTHKQIDDTIQFMSDLPTIDE